VRVHNNLSWFFLSEACTMFECIASFLDCYVHACCWAFWIIIMRFLLWITYSLMIQVLWTFNCRSVIFWTGAYLQIISIIANSLKPVWALFLDNCTNSILIFFQGTQLYFQALRAWYFCKYSGLCFSPINLDFVPDLHPSQKFSLTISKHFYFCFWTYLIAG
jgi:hypothetical protein